MDIPILDNMIVADSTVFSVALSSADPAAILNPANVNITIEDEDSKHATSGIVQIRQQILYKCNFTLPYFSDYS